MLLLLHAQQFNDGPFTDVHEHRVVVVVVVVVVCVAVVVARPNVNPGNVPMFSVAPPISFP